MIAKHTPTPWKVTGQLRFTRATLANKYAISDKSGKDVAWTNTLEEARLVERAVNSHAPMLEALRATVEFLTDTEIPFPPQLHDKITDAIHAAEAESAS